ncbi:MAG: sulfatase-like hydrolase/transferase [Planctomycetes bacterium]|nr:sulfatase-like hydrolase/transferase [Planctomycetota bacterium]
MNRTPLRSLYADRLRLVRALLALVLALGLVLRVVLYVAYHDAGFDPLGLLLALVTGVGFDLLCTLAACAFPLFLLAAFRLAWLRRPRVRFVLFTAFGAALLFDAAAQFLFFEEFNARYNHIALDYLMYPTEVFGNIWESYDVPLVVAGALAGGLAIAWVLARRLGALEFGPLPFSARWRGVAVVSVLCGVVGGLMFLLPEQVSANRITSEVAQNGVGQLVRAFVTAELDYDFYYATLPVAEARARAAQVLGFPAPSAAALNAPASDFELQREFVPYEQHGDVNALDVLVVMEESLGSNFVGVLGSDEGLTPGLDRWSKDGLLLTNLIANGNRTVRGLEGVLCSFVPLPGDSVVKKPGAENVATLGRVFQERGYATCFLYGGYGVFDHMKPFFLRNGWSEFVEQPDYPSDAFRTAWGVADEYIFDALLERQLRAREKGEHLFATVMSVSNHRPYDVPPERIDLARSRKAGVKYSDYAVARYLDQAKAQGVLDHTVVLVVGDHGARVYGRQEIPVESYRIPALFLAPDPAWKGKRIDRLCSQIDLAPTLLSLARTGCTAPFLGEDLLARGAGPGRAFVHHNNDIGLLTDDVLVVLGLNKHTTFYRRSKRAGVVPPSVESGVVAAASPAARRAVSELELVAGTEITPELRGVELDAAAVFQTAFELYQHGRFALPAVHR